MVYVQEIRGFWRVSSPRSAEARGDFKNAEGMVKCPRGAKTREPKLEKGKERKLKRNVKKEISFQILRKQYASRNSLISQGPAASTFSFLLYF